MAKKSKKSVSAPAAQQVPAAKPAVNTVVKAATQPEAKAAAKPEAVKPVAVKPTAVNPTAVNATVAKPATAPAAKPAPEAVSARAHQIWIDEGRPAGKSLEHWLRAERELGA